ncbi:hypothetical protein E3N88_00439 [Mikania micrantha]|uniref:Uncharacterized protein n=1 Tax=Mikania micrantha TaxID=192012 RepID=A0A5N6PYV0_9ASTR|nr:hypothetical protein E3N88_00439 [Mikania micrantha]
MSTVCGPHLQTSFAEEVAYGREVKEKGLDLGSWVGKLGSRSEGEGTAVEVAAEADGGGRHGLEVGSLVHQM